MSPAAFDADDAALLLRNLAAARRVAVRLGEARDALAPMVPLTPDRMTALGEQESLLVDAFLLRFGTPAAMVGEALTRGVLLASDESLLGTSNRDRRLRLEKLNVVRPGLDLGSVAEARNRLAHAYPDDPARQARDLNEAHALAADLLAALDDIAAYAAARLPPAAGTG